MSDSLIVRSNYTNKLSGCSCRFVDRLSVDFAKKVKL